ncbi:hypothetical protein Moror_3673 [Moniliophthora roreri MCA 2997]|uniref:Uncharacterized protein n=1 Tax=Moniliophthora roreri (strain MCA 2997) TaxID=1381753 RepID=V2XT12_MONRO|nr:hypothetical protein Moror_3673 [Moniliophthora roreri MCA 2997]
MAFAARRIPVKTPHDRYAPNSARISRWCIGESMKNSYLILMTDELDVSLTGQRPYHSTRYQLNGDALFTPSVIGVLQP